MKHCLNCNSIFLTPKKSERQYCCNNCRNAARSRKVKSKSHSFDPQKARAAILPEHRLKQADSIRDTLTQRHRGPGKNWLQRLYNDSERARILKLMGSRRTVSVLPSETGSIEYDNLRFDSYPELKIYKEFRNRGLEIVRSVPYNGWVVDFEVPLWEKLLEVKSWYTVLELQGIDKIVERLDDNVLMLEEKDIKGISKVVDIRDYVHTKSESFQHELIQLSQ